MINISKELQELANIFAKQTKLYIVGGYIRDNLLNIKSNDIDLCSCLTIQQVEEILKDTIFTITSKNKSFGTCKIKGKHIYEYTTFRKDIYQNNGNHFPTKVEFCTNIKSDSSRRDFTINALYYDILDRQLIDFYDSSDDIKTKTLRAIPKAEITLKNDGERILRLIKFAIKYNLQIEEETLKYAKKYSSNVNDLNANTIKKFLKNIDNFDNIQKENVKSLLLELNINLHEKIN